MKRHYNNVNACDLQDTSVFLIFQTILDWWLVKEAFDMGYQKLSAPIIAEIVSAKYCQGEAHGSA